MKAIILLTLGSLALYAYRVWRYPYVPCPRCNGGRKWAPGRSGAYRRCKKCQGSGEQLRPIRRLWNWYGRKS
jgi:DnaJ-class molecular chaperone